jgi:FAD/FMN-containing dehydrogenase
MAASLSRRNFLSLSTGAALAATLPFPAAALSRQRPVPEKAWHELSLRLRGALLRPGDATYAAVARPNNLRYAAILPAGIARCGDAADAAATLAWCREYRVPFALRSGGHSYAGFSTTDGLLIDLSPIKGSRYDEGTGVIAIAGGSVNRDIYAALRAANRTITHGRCTAVGAAAFLLGGGIGFNMRANGVACDGVTGIEMVTADGRVRAVDEKTDADLFWACRGGGGGNFGIATSFSLRTVDASPVTVFSLQWEKATEKLATGLLAALSQGPDTLGTRVSLQPDGQGGVKIDLLGQLKGSARELAEIFDAAYAIQKPAAETIKAEIPYWDGQAFLEEPGDPTYYQERSSYVFARDVPFLIERGFTWLRRAPPTHDLRDLRFFQTGGAIKRVARTATAYVHRDHDWLMVVGLYWTKEDARDGALIRRAHLWQDAFYRDLGKVLHGAYQNFPDPSLASWREAYYQENYFRLSQVRKRVDPDRVFAFAQGI